MSRPEATIVTPKDLVPGEAQSLLKRFKPEFEERFFEVIPEHPNFYKVLVEMLGFRDHLGEVLADEGVLDISWEQEKILLCLHSWVRHLENRGMRNGRLKTQLGIGYNAFLRIMTVCSELTALIKAILGQPKEIDLYDIVNSTINRREYFLALQLALSEISPSVRFHVAKILRDGDTGL